MSSRKEQKRLLRKERLANEAAASKDAARKGRIRVVGLTVLALVLVTVVAVAVINGGKTNGAGESSNESAPAVPIPKQQTADLAAAAAAAGCKLRKFPNYGQEHTTDSVVYKTNPATSGPHSSVPAEDGAYPAATPPAIGNTIHALEHGRIAIQWKPGLSSQSIGQLQTLFAEGDGYHTLLFANQTNMPYAVAASAWERYLGCPTFTPKVFDAIRSFRTTYVDKAPEQVP